jgi:hypothetical protein
MVPINDGAGSAAHLFLVEQNIDAESRGDWTEMMAGRLTPKEYAEKERVRNIRRQVVRAQIRATTQGRGL